LVQLAFIFKCTNLVFPDSQKKVTLKRVTLSKLLEAVIRLKSFFLAKVSGDDLKRLWAVLKAF